MTTHAAQMGISILTVAAARSAASEVGARAAVGRARGELILLYMDQSTDRTRRCAKKGGGKR
jgi:hypothetical protein